MFPEVIVDSAPELPGRLAPRLLEEARRAQAERGFFAMALPGGSVADIFFPRLAQLPLDWSRTAFFWGDERAVPASDPQSNYGKARALWLEPAKVPAASVHPMPADATDLDGSAAAYADVMVRVLGTPPRLDLVLLGVGPDGHVCSLFPGHRLLREERLSVAALEDSPKPPPRRLTLTLPTLAAADLVVVAAMGPSKAAAVRAALHDPASPLPLALVTRRARRALFLLDRTAADGQAASQWKEGRSGRTTCAK
jgi:6-phosphogluconolactonase